MTRFEGRTVIVTGAASGIGAATVRRLHDEGALVVAVDRTMAGLQSAAVEWGEGGGIVPFDLDVSDNDQISELIRRSGDAFPLPYGLVNCAGVRGVSTILDVDPEEMSSVLAVNLLGTVLMCKHFSRLLRDQGVGGAIVNVASAAGIRAVPNRLSYVASKFGVVGTTQTMALELAPLGVRVNGVAPGMIRTPMTESMFADPTAVAGIRASHPIGRAGEPHEVAAAIAFLLSDDASFVTGAVVPVDGGNTVGVPSFGNGPS